jgi:hypothetical protein
VDPASGTATCSTPSPTKAGRHSIVAAYVGIPAFGRPPVRVR